MIVGVPRESFPGERRVALVPAAVPNLTKADFPVFRNGQVLVGFLRPLGSIETIQEIASKGVTSFSVELMPRTTRAQSMDVLSSMATICGYKAVVLAADTSRRIFPMRTAAAGTITPCRVFVIGAGVAG